jgi:hypothetical protein
MPLVDWLQQGVIASGFELDLVLVGPPQAADCDSPLKRRSACVK